MKLPPPHRRPIQPLQHLLEKNKLNVQTERWLPPVLCLVVMASLIFFFLQTSHWPLVGDAAFIHYVVFLWEHGMTPFRQIVETQLPGVYLLDWAVMHIFGPGAMGTRLFDDALSLSVIALMLVIVWPQDRQSHFFSDDRWAAFLAGGSFVLVHGRDGLPQVAERDLVMAVLLLAVCACCFWSVRRNRHGLIGLAGLLASAAVSIKPTVLPAAGALPLLTLVELQNRFRNRGQSTLRSLVWMASGALLPVIAIATFLQHYHAFSALAAQLHGIYPYYAGLRRHSFGYLLLHSVSRLLPLLAVWLLSLACRIGLVHAVSPPSLARWEYRALYAALACSFISYAIQGKDFPYHRYPFLVFFFLLMMLEFKAAFLTSSDQHSRRALALRTTGILGLAFGALALAPMCVYKISQFDWRRNDFEQSLSADLATLGGQRLSGHIQCMDAFAGCIDTLYQMQLVQTTGFLVDFYFWAPNSNPIDPAILDLRRQFWTQMQANPPQVFVITDKYFLDSQDKSDSFNKLERWPAFNTYLLDHYRLVKQRAIAGTYRWTTHPEEPASYRIYVRKST